MLKMNENWTWLESKTIQQWINRKFIIKQNHNHKKGWINYWFWNWVLLELNIKIRLYSAIMSDI